jgi:CDP-diacylglycerol---glycerol-3-phosphate 3-phosphatidyltransferase
MANLITLSRFLLLFMLVGMTYLAPPAWQLLDAPLLILIIALDGVDGYVARKLGEASVFGSVLDIAVDRVVENVLWIVLADLGLAPVWVALVFITRSLLVDSIRAQGTARGMAPFAMIRSSLGRFLVAGRFMRGFYGTIKAITFAWLLLLQPCPALLPEKWAVWSPMLHAISLGLVYTSVTVCLLRGLPVLAEYLWSQGMLQNSHDIEESR